MANTYTTPHFFVALLFTVGLLLPLPTYPQNDNLVGNASIEQLQSDIDWYQNKVTNARNDLLDAQQRLREAKADAEHISNSDHRVANYDKQVEKARFTQSLAERAVRTRDSRYQRLQRKHGELLANLEQALQRRKEQQAAAQKASVKPKPRPKPKVAVVAPPPAPEPEPQPAPKVVEKAPEPDNPLEKLTNKLGKALKSWFTQKPSDTSNNAADDEDF